MLSSTSEVYILLNSSTIQRCYQWQSLPRKSLNGFWHIHLLTPRHLHPLSSNLWRRRRILRCAQHSSDRKLEREYIRTCYQEGIAVEYTSATHGASGEYLLSTMHENRGNYMKIDSVDGFIGISTFLVPGSKKG